jgi:hypothetical protein
MCKVDLMQGKEAGYLRVLDAAGMIEELTL